MTTRAERLVSVPMFVDPKPHLMPTIANMILELEMPEEDNGLEVWGQVVSTAKDDDGWPMDVYRLRLVTPD